MRGLWVIVLIALIAEYSLGQTTYPQGGFSVQPGFQLGTSFAADAIPTFRQYGFVLDLNRQTSGRNAWQADHGYPQMGLQLAVRGFPGTEFLHQVLSIIPYLGFNVADSKVGRWQIKHGTGLAYVAGDFEKLKRSPLGSRLNASSLLDLGYQFKINSALELKTGMALSHVSNGNLIRPNAGLNSWLAYGQLVYFPKGKLESRIMHERLTSFRRWRYRLYVAQGLYDYQKSERQIRQNWQVGLLAQYQHNTRFRTGGGLEVGKVTQGGTLQPAAYLEEEVLFAHLVTRYGLGVYLTEPLPDERRAYAKVGIGWYPFALQNRVPKGLSIGASIKAHGFRAAHVEWAAGYTF